jgi:probable HAF family extracellular repeat protein
MRTARRILLLTFSIACLTTLNLSEAKKPDNTGGGGGHNSDPPIYQLIDLLGFDNGDLGYQSSAKFITNPDENGNILIYGTSYVRTEGTPWEFHPALWQVDNTGYFQEPLDLGVPSFALEAAPSGINSWGVGVGTTQRAVEKDEEGNWVFPSWVDVPGLSYQELPTFVGRTSHVSGINDAGIIIGGTKIEDPTSPSGYWTVGVYWQLNPDGSVSDPVSLGEFGPLDINNHGVILGRYQGWPTIAWLNGGSLEMRQLSSSLEFFGADPTALNDWPIDDPRLTVVGDSRADETGDFNAPERGFAWRPFDDNDPTTILGTLGGRDSHALDVNAAGDIVGWSDTKRQGHQAFIYKNGVMSNLNSLTDVGLNTLQWAQGINDDGDIVGFMRIPRPVSEQRGFLLRLIESN